MLRGQVVVQAHLHLHPALRQVPGQRGGDGGAVGGDHGALPEQPRAAVQQGQQPRRVQQGLAPQHHQGGVVVEDGFGAPDARHQGLDGGVGAGVSAVVAVGAAQVAAVGEVDREVGDGEGLLAGGLGSPRRAEDAPGQQILDDGQGLRLHHRLARPLGVAPQHLLQLPPTVESSEEGLELVVHHQPLGQLTPHQQGGLASTLAQVGGCGVQHAAAAGGLGHARSPGSARLR